MSTDPLPLLSHTTAKSSFEIYIRKDDDLLSEFGIEIDLELSDLFTQEDLNNLTIVEPTPPSADQNTSPITAENLSSSPNSYKNNASEVPTVKKTRKQSQKIIKTTIYLEDLKPFIPKRVYAQLTAYTGDDRAKLDQIIQSIREIRAKVACFRKPDMDKVKDVFFYFLEYSLIRNMKLRGIFAISDQIFINYKKEINTDEELIKTIRVGNKPAYCMLQNHKYDRSLQGKHQIKVLQQIEDEQKPIPKKKETVSKKRKVSSSEKTSSTRLKKQKKDSENTETNNALTTHLANHPLRDDSLFSYLFTSYPKKEVNLPKKYVVWIKSQNENQQTKAKRIFEKIKLVQTWNEQSSIMRASTKKPIDSISKVMIYFLKIIPLKQKKFISIFQVKSHSVIRTWIKETNEHQSKYKIVQVAADRGTNNRFCRIEGHDYDVNLLNSMQKKALGLK